MAEETTGAGAFETSPNPSSNFQTKMNCTCWHIVSLLNTDQYKSQRKMKYTWSLI